MRPWPKATNEPLYFSGRAEKDPAEITKYRCRKWGKAQLNRYLMKPEQGNARLAQGDMRFKEILSASDSLRMAHIEHHYIVLRIRRNVPAVVETILHERMALSAQLAERMLNLP